MKKLSLFAALLLTGFTAFAQDGSTDCPPFGWGWIGLIFIILVGIIVWLATRNRSRGEEGYNQQWRGRAPMNHVNIYYGDGNQGATTDLNQHQGNNCNNPQPPVTNIFNINGPHRS